MAWLVGAYKKGDAFAASVKTKTVTSNLNEMDVNGQN